jgi:hypothetical protein
MSKKIMIMAIITLIVSAGILGVVGTTHAQEIETFEANKESEDLAVPVIEPEEASYKYEYKFSLGDQNGDNDPIMTQTRTQTQLRDLQDGECARDGEPQQLRLNLGAENQGEMNQQQLKLGDGTCNGDCVPLRKGGQGQ